MAFAKPKPKTKKEMDEERELREAQLEADFEFDLFVKYDMPLLIENIADESEWLTPENVLQCFDYLFYWGWDSKHTSFIRGEFRGHVPVEIAHKMHLLTEMNVQSYADICIGLEDIYQRHLSGAPDKEKDTIGEEK